MNKLENLFFYINVLLLVGFIGYWWQKEGLLLRPEWLWLTLPGLFLTTMAYLFQPKAQLSICDRHLQSIMVTQPRRSRLHYWVLSGLIAILALSGPSLSKEPTPLITREVGVVAVLDLSTSMLADDLPPNRLTRARFKLLDWLHNLEDEQVGLVVFSDDAFVVSPLTRDMEAIKVLLPILSPEIMPAQGENVGRALLMAGELLEQTAIAPGYGHILLITDANITAQDRAAARQLYQNGYRTSVLGIGTAIETVIPTEQGDFLRDSNQRPILTRVNHEGLAQLARESGGGWTMVRDDNSDIIFLKSLLEAENNRLTLTEETQERSVDHGIWLLFPLIFLNIGIFRLGAWE